MVSVFGVRCWFLVVGTKLLVVACWFVGCWLLLVCSSVVVCCLSVVGG